MFRLIGFVLLCLPCIWLQQVAGDCTGVTATLLEEVLALKGQVAALEATSESCSCDADSLS